MLQALMNKTMGRGLTREEIQLVSTGAPPTRWQRRHSATAKADRMEARQNGRALNSPRRKTGRQKPVPKPPTQAEQAVSHMISGSCTSLTRKQTLCQRKAKPGTFHCAVHSVPSTTSGA